MVCRAEIANVEEDQDDHHGHTGLSSVASEATIVRAPYLKHYLVIENRLCELFDNHLTIIIFSISSSTWIAYYGSTV
jgi:hypothetical protein